MFFESLIALLSITALFYRLGPRITLRIMGRPILFDLSVSALVFAIGASSVTGLLIATTTGFMAAGYTFFHRWAFGYIYKGYYYHGHIMKYNGHNMVWCTR